MNRTIKQLLLLSCIAFPMLMPVKSLAQAPASFPDFTQLVEQNHQAVVNISTTRTERRNGQPHGQVPPQFRGMPEEFLRHFFGLDPRQESQPRRGPERRAQSVGSGFIISQDGYILTNHHVIDGADKIVVRLSDRKEYEAELIGSDSRTDVALLRVDAQDLPTVQIGSADNLRVGEWVLAIGAPFGLDYTVTKGIVSAKGRNLPDDSYVPFIQTDVAINPGNSGGPLINLNGEVVGINAQIFTRSGGFMGLSFAIPIEIAMNVVEQLRETGEVARGYLGVQVQEVTSDLARSFNMDSPRGALVAQAFADSPAERAGIQSGDIILKFNDTLIEKSTDLPPAVGIAPISQESEILILRQGEEIIIRTQLAPLDETAWGRSSRTPAMSSEVLNVMLRQVDEEQLSELNIQFGVEIEQVREGLASRSGLLRGDILVSINFQPLRSIEDVDKVLQAVPAGQSVPLRVIRNGRSNFIALTID
ncbi:DegQ family serine endoprotease [Thiomicrospira sp. ALE5]|uniref:DegQ family serine endoprotease n=1 Tax=Thiomicrospira sp. ALE5 TaxID=748650 RepID=UPI0008EC1FC1|nr:DegQ family serine endoprotease [Thiomicrospira sp. ALE5]SFR49424.1 serine protease Do [Thiomicrospira sp. ALE5]